MEKLTQSYVHGASAVPLIGDTIGVHFDKAVARWPEAEALVVRHQGVRWTYRDLQQQVDACAAGLLALGLEPGDRVGHLVAQQCRVGGDAVCHGQGGDHSGEHQPGLSSGRAGVCPQQSGLQRTHHCRGV